MIYAVQPLRTFYFVYLTSAVAGGRVGANSLTSANRSYPLQLTCHPNLSAAAEAHREFLFTERELPLLRPLPLPLRRATTECQGYIRFCSATICNAAQYRRMRFSWQTGPQTQNILNNNCAICIRRLSKRPVVMWKHKTFIPDGFIRSGVFRWLFSPVTIMI